MYAARGLCFRNAFQTGICHFWMLLKQHGKQTRTILKSNMKSPWCSWLIQYTNAGIKQHILVTACENGSPSNQLHCYIQHTSPKRCVPAGYDDFFFKASTFQVLSLLSRGCNWTLRCDLLSFPTLGLWYWLCSVFCLSELIVLPCLGRGRLETTFLFSNTSVKVYFVNINSMFSLESLETEQMLFKLRTGD